MEINSNLFSRLLFCFFCLLYGLVQAPPALLPPQLNTLSPKLQVKLVFANDDFTKDFNWQWEGPLEFLYRLGCF